MKKENYFLILSLLFYLSSFAQAPGGVSTGLSLWTKSDNTTTGAWVDHSANANPVEVVGAMPLQAANASHNFQPYFTGFSTTNFFRDNTSSVAPANVFTPSDVTVISVVRASSLGTGRIVGSDNENTTAAEPTLSLSAGKPAFYSFWGNNTINVASQSVVANQSGVVMCRKTNGSTAVRTGLNGSYTDATTASTTGLWGPFLNIGYGYFGIDGAFPGDIQEVLWYNASLTDIELQKIHSYLAIKHGITFAQNYLASNGDLIWDRTANAGYNSNIVALGRDNGSALQQQVSNSVQSDVLALSTDNNFALANGSHAAVSNNSYFLMAGSNSLEANYSTFAGLNGTNARMDRIWKVQEIGTDQGIVYVKTTDSKATHLITSTDAVFGNADDVYLALTAGVAAINLSNNIYFTFAGSVNAPGGVLASLKLWLKADAGASTTTNNAGLQTWTNQTGANILVNQATAAKQPTYLTNSLNFNPTVSFDGTKVLTNATNSSSIFTNTTDANTMFAVSTNTSTTNYWKNMINFDGDDDFPSPSLSWVALAPHNYTFGPTTAASYHAASIPVNTPTIMYSRSGNSSPATTTLSYNGIANQQTFNNATGTYVAGQNEFAIGAETNALREPHTGLLPEVLVYNRVLTDIEVQKVNTYFAIKYGIQTTDNYLASDGAIIWNKTTNLGNHYNVTAIGRDDAQGLQQQVSKSTALAGDILIVSTDNDFTTANGTHGAVAVDNSFFVIGNNNGANTIQITEMNTTTYTNRRTREWKVSKTNFTQAVNLQFTGLDASWFLISDADGDFSSGSSAIGRLNANGIVTTSAITTGMYITLARPANTTLAQIGIEANTSNPSVVTTAELAAISGVTGVVTANQAAYQAYIDANTPAFSSPATVAQVQAMITAVNAAQTLLTNIGIAADTATVANFTAAQLNSISGVTGAVVANQAAYNAYIDANPTLFSAPATPVEVQAMITAVNATQTLLTNIGIAADTATVASFTAAQLNSIPGVTGAVAANEAAYNAYIDANANAFSAPATPAEVQAMIATVNAQGLLADIGIAADTATVANFTAAQLNSIPGVTGAVAANEAAYNAYIDANANAFSAPATPAEVQAMITAVNAAQTLLTNIGIAADTTTVANFTAAQLNSIPGVTGAVAANEAAYNAYIDANANAFSAPATAAEVQAMITAVNATQTLLTNIGIAADTATVASFTAAQLNSIPGVTGATAANEAAYNAYIDANANAFSAPATAAEVQVMVTAVNAAQTLLTNIGTAADTATVANFTAAQLNSIPGVTGAVAANEAAYNAYIDANANAFSAPATAAEVQAMVTAVNSAQTLLANIGIAADTATVANFTAAQLNSIPAVTGATAANEAAYNAYIDANANAFSAPATAAEVQVMVTAVNSAQTLLANIGTAADTATVASFTAAQFNSISGVTGATAANEAAYNAYIDANANAFSAPATAAEVQSMVTAVNAAQTLLANIGTAADTATVANFTAVQLNSIPGVTGATAANEAAYNAYIDANANAFSAPATAAEVQAMITAVNATQTLLTNIGIAADTATVASFTAAQLNSIPGVTGAVAANEAAYNAYIDANANAFSAPATAAEVQAMVTAVNATQTTLAQIGTEATTTAPSVVTTTQLAAIPGVTGVVAGNQAAYQAYIDANTPAFSSPATAAQVQAMITAVNAAQTLLANIGTAADTATVANFTAAQLSSIPGVTGATAANEAAYNAYIDANANAFSAPATAAEVQAMVTAVNVNNSVLATIGTSADAGTNPNLTTAQFSSIPGLTGVTAANTAQLNSFIAANANVFSSPATVAEVQNAVNVVNTLALIGTSADAGTNPSLTTAQLSAIPGVTGVTAANTADINAYIAANASAFSSPATVAEVQAAVQAVLSNNENSFKAGVIVYPNPFADALYISSTFDAVAELIDILGKVVIKNKSISIGETSLETGNLPSGIYLLRISNNNNETKIVKVVKR